MRPRWPVALLVLGLAVAPAAAQTRPLRPYTKPGVFSKTFRDELRHAPETFSIQFSNGRTYHGVRRLQEVGTNILLVAPGGRVLRLPSDEHVQDTLRSWVKGHRLLETNGVPVPKLYLDESDPAEYLAIEHLPVRFTFAKIPGGLPHGELLRLHRGLVDFMTTTWKFRAIGDFGADQLGWVGDRWVLLDMTGFHVPLRPGDAAETYHAISATQSPMKLFWLPDSLRREIDLALTQRRRFELRTGKAGLISAKEHDLPDEIEDY